MDLYIESEASGICVDMSRMNKILEIHGGLGREFHCEIIFIMRPARTRGGRRPRVSSWRKMGDYKRNLEAERYRYRLRLRSTLKLTTYQHIRHSFVLSRKLGCGLGTGDAHLIH